MPEEKLRNVTVADMPLLFQWVNDQDVRLNSFSQDPISYQEHMIWFQNCISDENIKIYIYMVDGCPIGQVRIRRENDHAQLSYSICKTARGKGYATRMLRLATSQVVKDFPDVESILAEVKINNWGSRKALLRAGYGERCVEYEMKIIPDACN